MEDIERFENKSKPTTWYMLSIEHGKQSLSLLRLFVQVAHYLGKATSPVAHLLTPNRSGAYEATIPSPGMVGIGAGV